MQLAKLFHRVRNEFHPGVLVAHVNDQPCCGYGAEGQTRAQLTLEKFRRLFFFADFFATYQARGSPAVSSCPRRSSSLPLCCQRNVSCLAGLELGRTCGPALLNSHRAQILGEAGVVIIRHACLHMSRSVPECLLRLKASRAALKGPGGPPQCCSKVPGRF